MVKMIVGARLAAKSRYRTRQLTAGDEMELTPRKARLYQALGWVRPAPPETSRGPGLPRRQEQAPAPAQEQAAPSSAASDDLEGLQNSELMERARERGLHLPSGYIPNRDLIERLRKG